MKKQRNEQGPPTAKKSGNKQPGDMDGFARRKEHSKEDIRKAAWELFGQFGVERVSIVDIAQKAGVSQATIYNNFGSKENLVREFVTKAVDQLVDRVQEVLSNDKPYWGKMTAFINVVAEMMASGRRSDVDGIGFTNSYALQDDPEIKKIRDSAQERMTDLLLGLIQEGKEQGQIRSDISEDALLVYFKAFMDIFVAPQFQHRYYKDPKIVQDVGALMIYGLSGQQHSVIRELGARIQAENGAEAAAKIILGAVNDKT